MLDRHEANRAREKERERKKEREEQQNDEKFSPRTYQEGFWS